MSSERGSTWWKSLLQTSWDRMNPIVGATPSEDDRSYSLRTINSALEGQPYFWSVDLCRLIEVAQETLPDIALTDDILPEGMPGVPYGAFFWFDHPLSLLDGGTIRRVPAMAIFCAITFSDDEQQVGKTSVALVHFGFANDLGSDTSDMIVPIGFTWWFEGETIDEAVQSRFQERDAEAWRRENARLRLRYLASGLLLMRQEIFRSESRPASRSLQRQLSRREPGIEPLIRVITLRRIHRQHDDSRHEENAREYSIQWIVRGHWRQQWYPSLNRHQPKWINPYVKGPEDKPLKPSRTTVYAVVR